MPRSSFELDGKKGKEGHALDEFESHRFLESLEETMTVMEMRKVLREIDVNADGKTSLLEYLIHRYKVTVADCCSAPQGENQAEVARAQALFDEVNDALDSQRAAVAELQAAEAQLAAAEAELQSAIDSLHAEEEAYHGRIASCEKIVADETIGVVKRNKAANELAQLKAEDPLPLRRAKITQEAALRKVGKEKARVAAAKEDAERKQAELESKLEEASAELERVKQQGGSGEGVLWWLKRVEIAADAYLPPNKQKYAHTAHQACHQINALASEHSCQHTTLTAMWSVRVSAPGKVILFGEHAVVYQKPAIAAALGLRTAVAIDPLSTATVDLELPDIAVRKVWSLEVLAAAAAAAGVTVVGSCRGA